jgi:hypothetical protein
MSADTINLDALRNELESARVERDLMQATMLLDPVRAMRFRERVLALADEVMPTFRHHTREQEAFRVKLEKVIATLQELSQAVRELPGTVHIGALDQSLERLGMLLHLPSATGDELLPIVAMIDGALASLRRVCHALPVPADAASAEPAKPLRSGSSTASLEAERSRPTPVKLDRALQQLTARLARDFRKDLSLETEGLERVPTELYTTFYDVCSELLANAAEHGIESPAARHAAGKDATAHLQLQIRGRPGGLTLNVRDDGRGLDATGIFRSAARHGLWPDDGRSADPREAARLIFKPGVTTSDDPLRGQGLRRVLTQLKKLGARIRVSSERGRHLRLCAELPHSAFIGQPDTRAHA